MNDTPPSRTDLVTLSVIAKSLEAIAGEMGTVLRKSAYSPNIKERLDFSCAIFDKNGNLVSQAEHIPVHLGALFSTMEIVLNDFSMDSFQPHDVIVLNSPYAGGTHLPDITVAMPIFIEGKIEFFVVNRAHHADIGGSVPGSMPGVSREIFAEGLIIPPVKLYDRGKENSSILKLILVNVRTPEERLGDFRAQRAALLRGEERIQELCYKFGMITVRSAIEELMNLSEQAFEKEIQKLPDGEFAFEDYLDSNGIDDDPVKIKVRIKKIGKRIRLSFDGTAPQQTANCNTPRSVVYSAVYYVFRCLTDSSVPTNAGLFRQIKISIPAGSLLDPHPPAAVSSGNVETSQRIVDVVFGALAQVLDIIPAASQGTMNNVSIGGVDLAGKPFSYYETIAGGCGAAKGYDGISSHSHMTNTLNTPIEALELAYPFRVRQYSFRPSSRGNGQYLGGDGLIREIEVLVDCTVSLQSERRIFSPYGLAGGQSGSKGLNSKINAQTGRKEKIPGRAIVHFKTGDILRVETPGGGGYGRPNGKSR
ncbi:MAG: hydantoinase B/oxoprolinase family protein [Candidatus Odinarchaeota archaeon]